MQGQDVGNVPLDEVEYMDASEDRGSDDSGGTDETGLRSRRRDLNSGPEKGECLPLKPDVSTLC